MPALALTGRLDWISQCGGQVFESPKRATLPIGPRRDVGRKCLAGGPGGGSHVGRSRASQAHGGHQVRVRPPFKTKNTAVGSCETLPWRPRDHEAEPPASRQAFRRGLTPDRMALGLNTLPHSSAVAPFPLTPRPDVSNVCSLAISPLHAITGSGGLGWLP